MEFPNLNMEVTPEIEGLVNSRRSAISVASVYQVDDAPSISFVRNTSAGV